MHESLIDMACQMVGTLFSVGMYVKNYRSSVFEETLEASDIKSMRSVFGMELETL